MTPEQLIAIGAAVLSLLMEYIPGESFDYHRDWEAAANVFARIHRVPTPDYLVTQVKPISSIVAESIDLLNRFDPRPISDIARRIRIYGREIESLAERHDARFAAETACIVNTEVNSGNSVVGPNRVVLVDWEKAVASSRYQDLGHFVVPTTTLWKTEFAFSPEQRRSFLSAYYSRLTMDASLDELDESTALLEKTILLRAYSWCFMAYAEYTSNRRPLMDPDTFKKINYYLDHTFDFLGV